jgi:dTDP-4-amino-4,6-dideoxygalactose transaminase
MTEPIKLQPQEVAFLPYCLPDIGEAEINEVVDALRSGWISTGPKVQRFERDFAEAFGASHAIAVSSCTAGLELALAALDIGAPDLGALGIGAMTEPDEVILPTTTFCSAANVILHRGALPVPVDVGEAMNIDPQAIERAITPRTRAIMPVHFAGQACELDQVYRIAAEHDLALIVDCAHAVGCTWEGQSIASDTLAAELASRHGRTVPMFQVFSFYATKNLSTGEGGMVTTSDDRLAERVSQLRLHGMSRDAWKRYSKTGSWRYDVVAAGFKSNMTDLQAALGIHQLARLPDFNRRRQELAALYRQNLADLPEVTLPTELPGRNHVFHLFVVQLDLERLRVTRDSLMAQLSERGIGLSVHFIPLHEHSVYRALFERQERTFGPWPEADRVFERCFSLPLYPRMSDSDVYRVCSELRQLIVANRIEKVHLQDQRN